MKYNILFILTDQERYFAPRTLPQGYSLPGQERLRREGVSFINNQICSSVCSSARSVIYTGQHVPKTGVFDNLGYPWSQELSPNIPTVATYLKGLGYYSAYYGKCHFNFQMKHPSSTGNLIDVNPDELRKVMKQYDFEDYFGIGDVIGLTEGGYQSDEFTTSTAISWLRSQRSQDKIDGKPWFLALNLVNPHDVMFFNTDPVGNSEQEKSAGSRINRDPNHKLYVKEWEMPLAESRNEPLEHPGRPSAHKESKYSSAVVVGTFPSEDQRWKGLQDYYLNCMADVDQHVDRILKELDDLCLTENTIVIMTSDHGELLGAHQMHGKGATAYKEQLNVPLYIRHPGYPDSANKQCKALTSHLDIIPTILSMAGMTKAQFKQDAPKLKGHDISQLLASPETATINQLRDSALYTFDMWSLIDAEYRQTQKENQNDEKKMAPDLRKRGAIRSVTDGKYRYTRYFSPLIYKLPREMNDIYKLNDIELFDLDSDPDEINNLAATPEKGQQNKVKLIEMNHKLNKIIAEEIGEDNGDFLPDLKTLWTTKYSPIDI